MELYFSPLSPYAKAVELLLIKKRVEFTLTVPERGFVREGGFGELTPLRKIPVLVMNGTVVAETQVILELVEELHPTPAALPSDPLARSRARLLARIADIYLGNAAVQLLNNTAMPRDERAASASMRELARGFAGLEHWLAPGPYAVADCFTIADCMIAPTLFFIETALPSLGVSGIPNLPSRAAAYLEAVRRDPDVGRVLCDMDEALSLHLNRTDRA